jgi:hypothetical protein
MSLPFYLQEICKLNITATEMLLIRKKIYPYISGITHFKYFSENRQIHIYHNNFITQLSLNHHKSKTTIRKMSI